MPDAATPKPRDAPLHPLGQNARTIRRIGHPHPGIPSRVHVEPRHRLGRQTFHRQLRHDLVVLRPEVTDPAVGQDHVRVQDLTRVRIHAARPDRRAHVVRQPPDEVVPHVLGVELHVRARLRVLLTNLDRVHDPDPLECLVPDQDAVTHELPIPRRHRRVDVEDDRLLRRAHLAAWILLLDVPPVDVPNPLLLVRELAQVAVRRREEAHPRVGHPRLVRRIVTQQADGIVEALQPPIRRRHLEGDLHVLREGLRLLDRRQPPQRAARLAAEERRRLTHQQRPHVDHRLTPGPDRQDRHVQKHTVREDVLHAQLALRIARRLRARVGLDQEQPIVNPLPVHVDVAGLQARVLLPRRHRHREEVTLALVPLGHLRHHRAVTLALVQRVQRLTVRRRNHLLEAAAHIRPRRQSRVARSGRRTILRQHRRRHAAHGHQRRRTRRQPHATLRSSHESTLLCWRRRIRREVHSVGTRETRHHAPCMPQDGL